MTYLPYVIAAYAVFVGVLAADWLAGLLAIARARRLVRQRQARQQIPPTTPSTELER